MAGVRTVITSMDKNGIDILGMRNLAMKMDDAAIVSGSLLTVESNHFCVVKSGGAVLNVYDTGQFTLVTPDKPIIGSFVQGTICPNSIRSRSTCFMVGVTTSTARKTSFAPTI